MFVDMDCDLSPVWWQSQESGKTKIQIGEWLLLPWKCLQFICHNFKPKLFWIYVSGVCSLPVKCGQWHQLRWQSRFVCRHALWLVPCLIAVTVELESGKTKIQIGEWLLLPWKCLQFIWTFRFWMFCKRGTVCTWYMLIEHSREGGMFATTPDNLKHSLLEGLSLFESDRSLSQFSHCH